MTVPAITINGEWFRCVSANRDPLSTEGARLLGGRLNAVGERALYMAASPTLAVAENLQLASLYGVDRFPPRLLVTIEVTLSRVVDLVAPATLESLGLTPADILGDWKLDDSPSPGQLLGRRLCEYGIEGALYSSAIEPEAANLVVYMRNVNESRSLHVINNA